MQNECDIHINLQFCAYFFPGVYQLAVNSATLNRLRSLFERGLTLPEIRNCPLIWRLYISLEVRNVLVLAYIWYSFTAENTLGAEFSISQKMRTFSEFYIIMTQDHLKKFPLISIIMGNYC